MSGAVSPLLEVAGAAICRAVPGLPPSRSADIAEICALALAWSRDPRRRLPRTHAARGAASVLLDLACPELSQRARDELAVACEAAAALLPETP